MMVSSVGVVVIVDWSVVAVSVEMLVGHMMLWHVYIVLFIVSGG